MIYQSSKQNIHIALAGDVMLTRKLHPFKEASYLQLISLLRHADLSFANLETVIRHPDEGFPNFTQGTPMTTAPELLQELKWMGLSLFSIANNHTSDYGTGGIVAMTQHLKDAGLAAAGAGLNMAQARAPAYVDTAAGRVGLIAVTAFFRPWNSASEQRPDSQGRPGIAPQAIKTSYEVDNATFLQLKTLAEQLGLSQARARNAKQFFSDKELGHQTNEKLSLWGQDFIRGTQFSVHTHPASSDLEANLSAIRAARKQCDWLLVSLHSHEFGTKGQKTASCETELEEPSHAATIFSRAAIDAGADMVAGHGPHVTLGVEVYKNRPIFYSLGNLVFQNDTITQIPSESYQRFGLDHNALPSDFFDARTQQDTRGFPSEPEYWEACIASVQFQTKQQGTITLHPIDLGYNTHRSERGRPVLAQGEKAERILERLERLSLHHGTQCVRDKETIKINLF